MKTQKYFLLLPAFLFFSLGVIAQIEISSTTNAKKIKPPELQLTLGGYSKTDTVTLEEGRKLLSAPLTIIDAKKTPYGISSYQFVYRKLVFAEVEGTGKVVPSTSISASLFKSTPLPEKWIQLVRQDLKPGDELLFVDVIVKDNEGRVMYAPELRLTIQ